MTDVDFCNAGASLSEARSVCTDPDQLIQATSCGCFSCASPVRQEYTLSIFPDLQLCDEEEESFYLSTVDLNNDADVYTYLDVRAPDDPPTSPALGDVYVACITKELLEFLRVFDFDVSSTTSPTTSTPPYTTTEAGSTVTSDGTTQDTTQGTTSTTDTTTTSSRTTTTDTTIQEGLLSRLAQSDLTNEDDSSPFVTLYALHADADDYRNQIVTSVLRIPGGADSLSIRVWDLGDGCHENWHPVNTDGGPVGSGIGKYNYENRVVQRSAAVYCNYDGDDANNVCESIVNVAYGRDRYVGQNESFPVDKFYNPSICLQNLLILGNEMVDFKFSMDPQEYLTSQRYCTVHTTNTVGNGGFVLQNCIFL